MENQKGGFWIALIIIIIAAGGIYYWQNQKSAETSDVKLTASQQTAWDKCKTMDGNPNVMMSEESGSEEVFCSFGEKGECTQRELNSDECAVK